ncbi:MAG: PIG-L deacetylase family protein [Rhodococcus sp. (in: high G+C Gram-positive bacteria)]
MVANSTDTGTIDTGKIDTEELGTPESEWACWDHVYPALDLSRCREMIVVAPHPDDEVLGVGGLMAMAAATGITVTVLAVTDGGASHPGSPTVTPDQLVAERSRETRRALRQLGLDLDPIRLGFGDGEVSAHEEELTHALTEFLSNEPGTWCLLPWRGDGHPDHEATARACLTASERLGITAVEYPVWMWHWARPGDSSVPWDRAFAVELGSDVTEAKRRAAAQFVTQTTALSSDPADRPVLPPHVLERLLRPYEVVFA